MQLTPKTVTRKLLIGVIVLLVCHFLVLYARFGRGHLSLHGFLVMFNLDDERNVPTLFSGFLIFLCVAMLWKVAKTESKIQSKLSFYWKALCAVTIFLFFDEMFSIHEIANHKNFKNIWPKGEGFFHFAWVVPYFFLGTAALVFFTRFLMQLPATTRLGFITAGMIYAGGALGMELIGGKYNSVHGFNLNYFLIIAVEEVLEMLGMVKFLSAIMNYFFARHKKEEIRLQISVAGDKKPAPAHASPVVV